ncbi:MAG: histidine kinase dimerization/phosphoacceptor domain -containing protein, partial [Brevundimonas sp.]
MPHTRPPSDNGLTPEIAELVAEVYADTAAETQIRMDDPVAPKVEETPAPETRSTADELRYRLKQQSLLARFGEVALRERDRQALLDAACEVCADGLETPLSKVLIHNETRDRLVLVAGVGWSGEVEGRASLGVELDSPAGYAFQTGKPLISNHLDIEDRFKTPKLLADHGVRRAINVLIRPELDGEPWGVLEVDSPDEGQFDARDALFLDAFAAVVGAAIARQPTEQRLLAAIEHQALLTREVSHRVKNSLSLVSSLLSMQARGAASDDVRGALATAGARIQAISQVHDQLWRGA